MIEILASNITVRAIASALLQSVWQGTVVCGITAVLLLALRRRTANARYVVACAGLAVMFAVPVFTTTDSLRDVPIGDIQRRQFAELSRVPGTDTARGVMPNAAPVSLPTSPLGETTSGSIDEPRISIWPAAIVLLWTAGVLVLSLRLFRSWLIVERIRRTSVQPVAEAWQARALGMAQRLRLMRAVPILESTIVDTPMVIGCLRPVILMPVSAFTGLSPAQLDAIIAHELAHIQRHDYLVNLLQATAETLLFYHPGVWWLSRQIRMEREHCCDDAVVALCDDRVEYARALANLEEFRDASPDLGLAATAGPLERRVRRILAVPASDEHRSALWVGIWLLTAALVFGFQDAQLRGAAVQLTQTSGGIRGQVFDARGGRPLSGASISVSQVGEARNAVSDSDGRYEIRGLEPGEYRLFVRAAGYLEAQYGQREPEEDGTAIAIRSGQIISEIDIRLQPSGILNGQILGDTGEGLPGVEIELLTERYLPGGLQPVPAGFAQTEKQGAFRVEQLRPGEYYVRAYVPPSVRPSGSDGREVYAPTYFPGVTRIDEAQRILVGAGQEMFDVHFALATARMHVVAGTLVGPASFDRTQVALMNPGGGSTSDRTVSVSSNGSFQFRNVVPGHYFLTVHGGGPQDVHWQWPMHEVTVDGDVSGLEMVARLGARVEGRFVRDGSNPLPFDPRAIRVGFEQRIERRPGIADLVHMFGINLAVQADGTFSIESPGGPAFLQVSDLPAGWTVKAIRLEGFDITDQAADFGDGAPRQVEIVLTDRIAGVAGIVTDRNGRAVSNYTVVVFPEDRDRWKPPSRLVRGVRPYIDGSFRIEDLPPATYRAIAVDSLPRSAWIDPSVLERLWSSSIQFRLNEAEQRVVNLRLSSKPDGLP